MELECLLEIAPSGFSNGQGVGAKAKSGVKEDA
jgi:hypothetical protein